jgi:molybdenum cofactor biosynthesis protein B
VPLHKHAGHSPAPHQEHKQQAPAAVACVVITCSDTRTQATDTSGPLVIHLLKEHGNEVVDYQLVKDDPAQILSMVERAVEDARVQAILINGGTGISRRDSTFDAVDQLLEKRLTGFGELFRYLTYLEIGSPAIMSRATAGVFRDRVLIAMPGSEHAVRLAMEKLILPELAHMVQQIHKQ